MKFKCFVAAMLCLCSSFLMGQNTVLWKITDPVNKNISYLLGTNHLFGESFIKSFPVIEEYLKTTGLIITETKNDRERQPTYYSSRVASDTIFKMLTKEDADYTIALMKSMGSTQDVRKLASGEIFATLFAAYPKFKCSALNKADTLAMDNYIQDLGGVYKKQQYYLETDSFQLEKITEATRVFDWKFFKRNMPALLSKYRKQDKDEKACLLTDKYAALNIDYKFEVACNFMKGSNLDDAVVKKRNEDWMLRLPKLLENNKCFIAVGIGHLYNKCGLLQQFKSLGFLVEPVSMQ